MRILSALLVVLALAQAPQAAAEPTPANTYLQGIDTAATVKLVRLGAREDNRYLIEAAGIDSPFSGQPLIYTGEGRDGTILRPAADTVRLSLYDRGRRTLVRGTVTRYWELFVGVDEAPIRLVEVPARSGGLDGAALLNAYHALQGWPAPDQADKATVLTRLNAAQRATRSACGSQLEVAVDWRAFETGELIHAAGSGTVILNALTDLCRADADYREAIGALRQLRLRLADAPGGHALAKQGTALIADLPRQPINFHVRAPEWLRANL